MPDCLHDILDRETIDSIDDTGIHPSFDLQVPEGLRSYQLEEAEEAFEGAEIAMSEVNYFGVGWGTVGLLVEAGYDGTCRHQRDGGRRERQPAHPARGAGFEGAGGLERRSLGRRSPARPSLARWPCGTIPAWSSDTEAEVLEKLAETFRTDYYHVWTSTYFTGAEVCAAMKNCYAFGDGFMEGLLDKEGKSEAKYRRYNYGAALFGHAARELGQWTELLGGDPENT